MQRRPLAGLALFAAAGLAIPAAAQDDGPGWTGVTNIEDLIAARQELMFAIEDLMRPIDTYTVDASVDPDRLTANAASIVPMMRAVPHLFPPTTNLYDPDAEYPATLALPHIWEDFPAFYAMAGAAAAAATALTEAAGEDALRAAALGLRASCDACHALNLRPYEASKVTEEDLDFDFESIFEN